MTYERNKVWQDDATLWLDALEKYPSSFRIQNNLATAYTQSGRTDLAESAFRESIRLNPRGTEAKVNLAILCLNQGRLGEAVLWVQDIDPKEVRAPYVFFNLGVIYAKQGNLAKAMESYQFARRPTRTAGESLTTDHRVPGSPRRDVLPSHDEQLSP